MGCLSGGVAHSSRFASVALVFGLAACGGKSFDVEPDLTSGGSSQAGSGQGGSGHGGNGSAGSGHAGSGSKGGGTGQGGGAGVCGGFDDEPDSPVNVMIINKTSAPIYLGQDMVTCGVSPLFSVAEAGGGALPAPSSCTTTCQQLRDVGPIGCPSICAFPSSVALQPGETLHTSWSGVFTVERQLPTQCASPDYGSTCQQIKQIQPGNFTFSAMAGRSIDCKATTGGACGACSPGGNNAGGCTIPGSLIAGPMLTATTSVSLDYRYGVWGSPQPAPLPARPGGSGSPGAALMLLGVELIFTD